MTTAAAANMRESGGAPRVAMLASPGMGHLIPVAELAKLLVLRLGFTATIITFSNFPSAAQNSLLAALPAGVSSASLPLIPLDDLPPTARIETRLSVLISRSVPHVRDTLLNLQSNPTHRLAAYIIDIFGGDTLPATKDLGIPRFLFCASSLIFLSFGLRLPELDSSTSCEYRDLQDPVQLPGCPPLCGGDLIDPIQDRSDEACRWMVHIASRFKEADGILSNTFEAMEPGAISALRQDHTTPPVFPIGPLVRAADGDGREECIQWLDGQPKGSVVFVSFGSGGTLSASQVEEVAAGLEMSGQRFLWVVRSPDGKGSGGGGSFFGRRGGGADERLEFLPEGFVERTKGVGMVVVWWAPQVRVLQHEATGGFVTHCGWNSTLESVVSGVPMVAWPLYAEQRMNAVMLAESVGVALRVAEGESGGVVGREEVARVVRELMEDGGGSAARRRVRELQAAAAAALSEEGSSCRALDEVTAKWKHAAAT